MPLMYKSPVLQMPFRFQRRKTLSVRPGKKEWFSHTGVSKQVFGALMYCFICFHILMVLPITKLLLKHAFLTTVGLFRRASNEVFLQSIRSVHNHAGQESSSEGGALLPPCENR